MPRCESHANGAAEIVHNESDVVQIQGKHELFDVVDVILQPAESQGRLKPVLDELGFNILSTLKLNGFENHACINDTWLRAYGSRFSVPADSAGAIGWAQGLAIGAHRFEVPDVAALEAIRSRPALAIWGDADRTLAAEHFLPLFSELFPLAPIHRLTGVGHYSFEDAPQKIADLIATFLKTTDTRPDRAAAR